MAIESQKSQAELVSMLAAIAADVAGALDEEALSVAVQKAVEQLVDVTFSGLFFFDPALGRLRMFYARGFTPEERKIAEDTVMERHPGKAFKTRKIIHVEDVEGDPEIRTSPGRNLDGGVVQSGLYLPIIFRDECLGVFGLASAIPHYFTPEHVASLEFLATLTGVCHANLRHIRAIMAQVELVRTQRAELRELSAPILRVGHGSLLLPVIGRVDRSRAEHMQERLLGVIASERARAVILDLTGMAAAGADALAAIFQIAKASALMGARCVISGITARAAIEMASVEMPVKASDIFGTVEAALASVLRDR